MVINYPFQVFFWMMLVKTAQKEDHKLLSNQATVAFLEDQRPKVQIEGES